MGEIFILIAIANYLHIAMLVMFTLTLQQRETMNSDKFQEIMKISFAWPYYMVKLITR